MTLLSDVSLSAPSDVDIHVYPIEKEPIIKIYLYHSLTKIEIVHKDNERIILKLSTGSGSDDTIFVITKNYIAELRNIVNIYVLRNYEEFDLDKLKFDIDVEYEYYDDDYDYRFYLKIQTE